MRRRLCRFVFTETIYHDYDGRYDGSDEINEIIIAAVHHSAAGISDAAAKS
jgi:hypothetical protein